MPDPSFSLAHDDAHRLKITARIGLTAVVLGFGLLLFGWLQMRETYPLWVAGLSLVAIAGGTWLFAHGKYSGVPEGIKNNGLWRQALTNRGVWGWLLVVVLTGFYVLLYWWPQYLGLGQNGAANTGLVALFDPLSHLLKKQPASEWFVYGGLYTVLILAMGLKFMYKYRHNRYQVLRTLSVIFFQAAFAFLLPELLLRFNQPFFDFKNMWPLNYYFTDGWFIKQLTGSGNFGLFMLIWGTLMVFVISPLLTYFFGKRWYCSWVCGCGGLAETAGDPFRHLSDKSLRAWRIERWLVHGVLFLSVAMTLAVLYAFFLKSGHTYWVTRDFMVMFVTVFFSGIGGFLFYRRHRFPNATPGHVYLLLAAGGVLLALLWRAYLTGSADMLFVSSDSVRKFYGFWIGAAFSGVIGVGFYPILGSRVWCRFGCPMAAILGLQQKFLSRFRITVNGGQCISCGNCSAFCEMGIDVRSYAQRGQDVVRASCVGCGICAAVCPRGVLRLENGSVTLP
ncbi:MAG: 4Fe-4S binding protein [Saprospiraceae bacterium]|jgi:polyferredoxin|nr:4Fe-4S binding protein [Saprospiraceae bacterium]